MTPQRARRRVAVTFTRRAPKIAPQTNVGIHGAHYAAGDERFYPVRITREGHLVLRSVTRSRSHIMEECSGPCDPTRWRPPR